MKMLLKIYYDSFYIERIRTRDFGALFELNYKVKLKPDAKQKNFIDELRCRNGNLNIVLTLAGFENNSYN